MTPAGPIANRKNVTMTIPAIAVNALFGKGMEPNMSADYEQFIENADVIFGVDVMSEREFLVYGRKALRDNAISGQVKTLAVTRVALDQETEELEKLVALIRILRGSDDYLAGEA